MRKLRNILLLGLLAVFTLACEEIAAADDDEVVDSSGSIEEETDSDSTTATGTAEIYEYSPALVPSLYYTVRVNGEYTTVVPTDEHDVCVFGADGPVTVVVRSLQEVISSAEVLPISKNYEYTVANDAVTLVLSPGDQAVVEINGSEDKDLFIFVNDIETDKPDPDDPNVLYYSAGTMTDTSRVSLSSGMTLYVEGGGILCTAVKASGATDIAIRGCGIIDSRGISARGIEIKSCEGITIEDVTLLNDIEWSTMLCESNDITVDNYKVVAVENPENSTGCENDAFDLLASSDASVTNCFGYAHDDVFCVKSQKWGYASEVTNVSFDNCIAWNYLSGNCFVVGAETNQDVSGVSYTNCYSIHGAGRSTTLYRAGISVHHCAAGTVSDILFENIVLEDCKEYGIILDIRKTSYDIGTDVEFSPGVLKNVTLKDITLLTVPPRGNLLMGYNSSYQISDVVFQNLTIAGAAVTSSNFSDYFTTSYCSYTIDE